MTDPLRMDEFERRLVDEFAWYTAVARDPRPSRVVAAEAMSLGRRRTSVLPWARGRLLLVAAALLLTLAAALAIAVARPDPGGGVVGVAARTIGDVLEVSVVRDDGSERHLRRLTPTDLGSGPDRVLRGGALGSTGWLWVQVDSTLDRDYHESRDAFVDLADPARPAIVLPSNGFVGPRVGPDGRVALVCGPTPDCGKLPEGGPRPFGAPDDGLPGVVRVLDLAHGTEIVVHGVELLGGTPEPIWTRDGRGFLSSRSGWTTTPLVVDAGPASGLRPEPWSRRYRFAHDGPAGSTPILKDALTVAEEWVARALAPATAVDAQNTADGQGIWLLLDDTLGPTGGTILERLDGYGRVGATRRIAVPGTPVGFTLMDDDSWAGVTISREGAQSTVLVQLAGDGETVTAGPVLDEGWVDLVPAATAETWPSG